VDTQRQSAREDWFEAIDRKPIDPRVYAIDPRGVQYTGPTVSDNLGNRTGTQIADTIGGRASRYINSQDGMVLLAQKTGGLFFPNANDLSVPLSKAIDDGDGYYLMGYQPELSTFETKSNTAKYRTLRVKRPGLKSVTYRILRWKRYSSGESRVSNGTGSACQSPGFSVHDRRLAGASDDLVCEFNQGWFLPQSDAAFRCA
jgi:hypothetical protein